MAKGTTTADIRGKSETELLDRVKSAKNELFQARFDNHTNKLNDTAKISKLRKEIAKLNTVLTERRLSKGGKAEG